MLKHLSAVIAAIVCVTSVNARSLVDCQLDSLKNSHRIVYIDGTPHSIGDTLSAHIDSVRTLIDNFYYDQFRHFQDPAAPYFLFMSKDARLAMGIGGCVRLRGWYDWGGAIPANGFAPYLIPMTPDPTNERKIGSTPAGTCLFFKVIGRDKRFGNYQLYIEANFNGYKGRDFHLKKAYGIINDWTLGYANSTFSDPAAVPPTVDAQGPANKISPTNLLIRWMHTIHDRYTVALSVETPETTIGADNTNTKKVSEWLPDFAGFAQIGWGENEHVRLAGIVRTLSYRDMNAGRNHNIVGWGLQLSTVWHPLPSWTVYASANGGRGYESLVGDMLVGLNDLAADTDRQGHLYAPAAIGWNIGLQYNFTPSLFVSAAYSQSRYLPKSPKANDLYSYGQVIDVNLFWNLTPRIQTGAELDFGMRHNFGGESKWSYRAGLMAQFSF